MTAAPATRAAPRGGAPAAPSKTPQQKAFDLIQSTMEARKGEIAAVISGDLTPERMLRMMLGTIRRQPELLQCTAQSIYNCVHLSASLGLEIGTPLGDAYVVAHGKEATLYPGYRGLARLAVECGAIRSIRAYVVHACDEFELAYGLEDKCLFRPSLTAEREEDNAIGVLTIAVLGDGTRDCQFTERAVIEIARSCSKQPKGLIWTKHWRQGWKKTGLRRHLTSLPLKPTKKQEALQRALYEADPDAGDEAAIDVAFSVTDTTALEPQADPPPATRTEQMKRAIAPPARVAAPAAAAPTPEPPPVDALPEPDPLQEFAGPMDEPAAADGAVFDAEVETVRMRAHLNDRINSQGPKVEQLRKVAKAWMKDHGVDRVGAMNLDQLNALDAALDEAIGA